MPTERDTRPVADRRILPVGTAFQIGRTAGKLYLDISGVFTMVANAVTSAHAPEEARSAPCSATLAPPGSRQPGKHLTDQ